MKNCWSNLERNFIEEEMFTLKKLKIKGFRAYTKEKEFTFDNPIVLFFGENHRGKSSTLNAIEWCLFGNECTGEKSGIRERIDWEIKNRNLSAKDDVFVELEVEDEKGNNYKILRRFISKTKDELKITLPDGRLLTGQEAGRKLAELLNKSSFRDFLTTVYQHQEVIRAVLTQKPKERNDAIDRLLGLSDYRNILSGIDAANLSSFQKEIDNKFDEFVENAKLSLSIIENLLRDRKGKACQTGLKESQICEEGALEIAENIKNKLQEFASKVGLNLTELKVPEEWRGLDQFIEIAKKEIERFRTEMPSVKKQGALHQYAAELARLKDQYEREIENLRKVRNELEKFIREKGDETSLNKEISNIEEQISKKKKEMHQIDAKAATINQAMEYLRLEGVDKDICPICGKKTENLLEYLQKEWEAKYRRQVGEIRKEVERLEEEKKKIENSLDEYKKLSENVEKLERGIKTLREAIGKVLKREITLHDDPIVLLHNKSKQIKKELKKLGEVVKSRQQILNEITNSLEQVQLIVDILQFEEKKKIVERIKKTEEYRQMEALRDEMAKLIAYIEDIKQAIGKVSHEEAQQKIQSAGDTISKFFCNITNNPMINKVEFKLNVDRYGKNNYEFKDQNGRDITPILSQGDLNALALSIFFGMACLKGTTQPFGFVMLDDPSQSLGSEHKEKLVEIFEEILKERMIVLSTMDKELQDLILSRITKAKTKYIFTNWTPHAGPEVRKE